MVTDSGIGVLTVYDYLVNKVKFDIPQKTLLGILVDRNMTRDMAYEDCEKDSVRLAYADMLKWIVLGPSKFNNTSDTDNGWTHSGGGYELSDDDREELKAEANAIYSELEPESVFKRKSTFRITSHGIKKANVSVYGSNMPHLISGKVYGKNAD